MAQAARSSFHCCSSPVRSGMSQSNPAGDLAGCRAIIGAGALL
jgi:hypothetical protein